jgi:hypothetical protein
MGLAHRALGFLGRAPVILAELEEGSGAVGGRVGADAAPTAAALCPATKFVMQAIIVRLNVVMWPLCAISKRRPSAASSVSFTPAQSRRATAARPTYLVTAPFEIPSAAAN